MKILFCPVNFSNIHNYNRPIPQVHNNILPSYACDNVTFEGKDYSNYKPINLEPALEISGVHCPGCGAKMLSQNDYNELIERAGNVNSTVEFVELLKEYKKYIPNNMKKILSGTDNIESYRDMSISEYIDIHEEEAFLRRRQRIHQVKSELTKIAQNQDFPNKDEIMNAINEISSKDDYKVYKTKISNIISSFNMDGAEKHHLLVKSLRDVAKSSVYLHIFMINNYQNLDDSQLSQKIIKHIFKYAVSNMHTIQNYPEYSDNPYNKLLLCQGCVNKSSKYAFWDSVQNPRLSSNIYRYFADLAKLRSEGKILLNSRYYTNFNFITDKISRGKVKLSDSNMTHLMNLNNSLFRHESFEPIMQSKVDVPCADCGTILITHDVRNDIIDELEECCTPKDYDDVLRKYDKYIGPYARSYAEIFHKIIKNNPTISADELVEKYQKMAHEKTKFYVKIALKKYYENRKYAVNKLPAKTLELYDAFGAEVRRYIITDKFDDRNFKNLLLTCSENINMAKLPKACHVLMTDLRKAAYVEKLSTTGRPYDVDDKDELYTLIFNLFKPDVATADHLVAHSKGGSGEKYNLIGLCKACNLLKSSKSVSAWYSQNLGVRYNLPKQLKVIDEMAQANIIEGYDCWAKGMADELFELTYGKFDIRDTFN